MFPLGVRLRYRSHVNAAWESECTGYKLTAAAAAAADNDGDLYKKQTAQVSGHGNGRCIYGMA